MNVYKLILKLNVVFLCALICATNLHPALAADKNTIQAQPGIDFRKPISLQDIPLQAKVIKQTLELSAYLGAAPEKLMSVPTDSQVYILRTKEDAHAKTWYLVLSSAGHYGWLPSSALRLLPPVTKEALLKLNAARTSDKLQDQLSPELKELLQAVYASQIEQVPFDTLLDEQNKLKFSLIAQKAKLAFPVLLVKHMRYLARDMSEDYFDDSSVNYLHQQIDDFLSSLKPINYDRVVMQNAICSRFGYSENGQFGFYPTDTDPDDSIFGLSEYASGYLDVNYSNQPPAPCVLAALKKISAINQSVVYPYQYEYGLVEVAIKLLSKWQSKSDLQAYFDQLTKNANNNNFAYLLMQLPNVDIAPYAPLLVKMAKYQKPPALNSSTIYSNQVLALRLLRRMQPSDALYDLALGLVQQDKQLADSPASQVKVQALKLLVAQKITPDSFKLLIKLTQSNVPKNSDSSWSPDQIRQIAVERLVKSDLFQQARSSLLELAADHDPYIAMLMLSGVRNEVLIAMQQAETPEKKMAIRSNYLLNLRKSFNITVNSNNNLRIKTSPIWMIKPNSKITIQADSEIFSDEGWSMSLSTPNKRPDLSGSDAVDTFRQKSSFNDEFVPVETASLDIHQHQLLLKSESGAKANKKYTITMFADQLLVDGQPAIDPDNAGIYQFKLINYKPGTEEKDWITVSFYMYCEPNEVFWDN